MKYVIFWSSIQMLLVILEELNLSTCIVWGRWFDIFLNNLLGDDSPILTYIVSNGLKTRQLEPVASLETRYREIYVNKNVVSVGTHEQLMSTWRILTLIYKPFRPFGRGPTTLLRGLRITMVVDHLQSPGMILQVQHVVISQRTMPSESPGYHMQTMRWFKDAEQEKCFPDPFFRRDPVRMGRMGLSHAIYTPKV